MQIQKISNNTTNFQGLYIKDVHKYHMNNFVEPCKDSLEKLAQKADIYIHTRVNPYKISSDLEYAILPFKEKDRVLRWATIPTDKKASPTVLAEKINSMLQNIEK